MLGTAIRRGKSCLAAYGILACVTISEGTRRKEAGMKGQGQILIVASPPDVKACMGLKYLIVQVTPRGIKKMPLHTVKRQYQYWKWN
jgi:hypothetical protein